MLEQLIGWELTPVARRGAYFLVVEAHDWLKTAKHPFFPSLVTLPLLHSWLVRHNSLLLSPIIYLMSLASLYHTTLSNTTFCSLLHITTYYALAWCYIITSLVVYV